jgi:vacuolar-type H+-ATPase subunit I/STV1
LTLISKKTTSITSRSRINVLFDDPFVPSPKVTQGLFFIFYFHYYHHESSNPKFPKACGYQAIKVSDSDNKTTERFIKKLRQCLQELKKAYPQMLEKFSKQLRQALQLEAELDLASLRLQIKARFSGLEYYSPDKEGLIPFIRRLQNNQDTAWLESIATFLGRIPPMKWHEEHRLEAENRLYEFSQRLIDLAKLHSQSTEESHKKGVKTVLIRTIRQGKEIEHLVYIENKQRKKITEAVKKLHQTLDKISDHQLQLAILAELFEGLDNNNYKDLI